MNMFEQVDKFKQVIDSARPFEGKMLEEIRAYYRIGLTWSSNALEGNTLTESETKILLEDGLTAGGRPLAQIPDMLQPFTNAARKASGGVWVYRLITAGGFALLILRAGLPS